MAAADPEDRRAVGARLDQEVPLQLVAIRRRPVEVRIAAAGLAVEARLQIGAAGEQQPVGAREQRVEIDRGGAPRRGAEDVGLRDADRGQGLEVRGDLVLLDVGDDDIGHAGLRFQETVAFDEHRDSHAAGDAERRDAQPLAAFRHAGEQGHDDARSGGPDRVAEGDGAAVGVDPGRVERPAGRGRRPPATRTPR